MRKAKPICVSINEELVIKSRKFAKDSHRTFSGAIELALQKFFEDEKHE